MLLPPSLAVDQKEFVREYTMLLGFIPEL